MDDNKISQYIDAQKFNKFHFGLVFWGVFLITFTGYGAAAYGSVVSFFYKEWPGLSEDIVSYIASFQELGSLFGAIYFSSITYRYGIKKVLIASTMLYCLGTFGQSLAPSIYILGILRVVAGFGFGGVIPLVISLVSEYSPKTSKSKAVTMALSGNQIGSIIVSIIAIYVTSQMKWRPIFWLAVIPVVFVPYIFKVLPESSLYLIHQKDTEGLKKVLARVNPNFANEIDVDQIVENYVEVEDVPKVSYLELFRSEYGLISVLSCLIAVMGLLFMNAVITWLPSVMVEAGYKLDSGWLFTIFLCGGAIIGSFYWAAVADKKGFAILMPMLYILGSISLMLMGMKSNLALLYIFITLVGFFLFSAHSLVSAFVAQHYPEELRVTAVSLPNSLGRLGGLLGPSLGGELLAHNVSVTGWFMVFAGAGLIAAVSFIFINISSDL